MPQPEATIDDLTRASAARMEDAEALFLADRHPSSIAMGLYALEIRLKVLICIKLDLVFLPKEFQIHQLDRLLLFSGLSRKIRRIRRPRGVEKNWDELEQLSRNIDKFRYRDDPSWHRTAAAKVLAQLRDPPNGVLLWLSRQA